MKQTIEQLPPPIEPDSNSNFGQRIDSGPNDQQLDAMEKAVQSMRTDAEIDKLWEAAEIYPRLDAEADARADQWAEAELDKMWNGETTDADSEAERDLREIEDSYTSDDPRDLTAEQLDFLREFHDLPSENPEEDEPAEGTARAEWLRRKLIGAEGMRRADEWAENELESILAERDGAVEAQGPSSDTAPAQDAREDEEIALPRPEPTSVVEEDEPAAPVDVDEESAEDTEVTAESPAGTADVSLTREPAQSLVAEVTPGTAETQRPTRLAKAAYHAGRLVGQRRRRKEAAHRAPAVHGEQETGFNARRNERSARTVPDSELVRNPDNNGRVLDPQYREGQRVVREHVVGKLLKGTLYNQDPARFERELREIHKIAVKGGYEGRHDLMSQDGQNEVIPGEYRGDMLNQRLEQALNVAEKARESGDSYAELFEGRNVENVHHVRMKGIPKEGWASEKARLGDQGRPRAYHYFYPRAEYIGDYIDQYNALGLEIQGLLAEPAPDVRQAVRLIGRQYKYGALMRPFEQVNNSLFMNIANAQLKLFGLKGVSHGELDLEAQRVSQPTFEQWFADHVEDAQK